jgi:hypothetical protein
MIYYPNPVRAGTDAVNSHGDGYSINVKWFQAEHSIAANKVAYHIYFATVKENVYAEGVKYISIDDSLQANLIDLIPGQEYFVAVRPVEYDPNLFDLDADLPIAYDNLRYYPYSLLRENMTDADLIVPLIDVSGFPLTGVVQVGVELIRYLAVDQVNNNLIVPDASGGLPAELVDLGGGNFYQPFAGNTGVGTVDGLAIVNLANAPTETWNIICVFVQRTNLGVPIAGTAKFTAVGSVSGVSRNIYGDPYIWVANGANVDSTILGFAITETGPVFVEGDGFIVKVAGSTIGSGGGRGYNNTTARPHTVGGFDGSDTWDPAVRLTIIGEDTRWDRIFACQSRFEYPSYQFTMADGYHQVPVDLLSTDLSAADASNVTFPMYDFAGYHRTDPVQLLNGTCVGSYIGGEMGCIDGYGNFNILRGFSLQDQNTQRQDVLLSVTGRDAVLIKRMPTGITCACYLPSSENQDDRCPLCYGTKFVFGYEQYFNPRSSDGRIKVRPSPTAENARRYEAGLESEYPLDLWTLTVPTIKTRDVLVLFDQDDNEEFRYEVSDVIRNNTVLGLDGGQHLKTFRVRKFDPIYQIRIFRNTASFPAKLNTSIGFVPGIPPHTHEIVINEHTTSLSQINQTTAVSQGHNHPIINGEVMEVLGHTHTIILPP